MSTIEELQAKLVAAQTRRSAAGELLTEKALEAEIRKTEREAEDDEFAAKICADHVGELGIDFDFLRFGDFLVAVRRPDRLIQDLWNKKVAKLAGLPDGAEIRNYVKKSLVLVGDGEAGVKAAVENFDKASEAFSDAPVMCLNLIAALAQGGTARRKGK